jgi:5-dehydro-2-deoxygluconokinase
MSEHNALHLTQSLDRQYQALVIGRAGMDLYPQPDGCKIRDAESFSTDLGGSAGNIAVAMSIAGAKIALLSALSADAVGEFVRKKLEKAGVDTSLVTTTLGNERTSLALAEVRQEDCEVVIYRNNPADLAFTLTDDIRHAIKNASHLVITGTSLIDSKSRSNIIEAINIAQLSGCVIWFDLDYLSWNWLSKEETRKVYQEVAAYCHVLIGNEEEFATLSDDLEVLIQHCQSDGQVVLLKRGSAGSSLFVGEARLDSGIYPVTALKPFGSGDAFLGNLLVSYLKDSNWQKAIDAGSAAAALVVSRRGCASAMPSNDEIFLLQTEQAMIPAAIWS